MVNDLSLQTDHSTNKPVRLLFNRLILLSKITVIMKSKVFALLTISFCLLLFGVNHAAQAESQALQQLLEIFGGRSLLSPEEVQTIRKAMAEDEGRLIEKEEALEEKKKALLKWERELGEKEEALRTQEYFFSEKTKRSSEGKSPGREKARRAKPT